MKYQLVTVINRIVDYKPLQRITSTTGQRYYIDPDGNHCPSVTTILSSTNDNPGLDKWVKRVGLVEANRVRDEAAGIGTLLHQHLESHIEGKSRPSGNNIVRQLAKNMADQIINRGLSNVSEVWGIEESLYYPGLYAGTADLIGIHKGTPAILDYKTCRVMKKSEDISDYFMQLCGYMIAHNEVYGTKINKGVIFMIDRNLEFQEFIVEADELIEWQEKWLKRIEQFLENQLPIQFKQE